MQAGRWGKWGWVVAWYDGAGALAKLELVTRQSDVPREADALSGAITYGLECFEQGSDEQLRALSRVPATTPFYGLVRDALLSIPRGSVRSYRQIAEMIGKPNAARAVGGACAKNPLLLVVPCHRVIATGGGLGGFGPGLPMKRALLALEGVEVGEDNRVKGARDWADGGIGRIAGLTGFR